MRAFARLGNRRNRARARLKFVAERLGEEHLRREVAREADAVGGLPPLGPFAANGLTQPPPAAVPAEAVQGTAGTGDTFDAWRETNTVAQSQEGFAAVLVAPPAGNLAAAEMQVLGRLAGRFGDGRLRLALTQDVVLPWVRAHDLSELHRELVQIGLGAPGARRAANVTGCPGSSTCNLALTASSALARQLRQVLPDRPEYGLADDLADVRIKVSGCPNSCGHHQAAGVGLQGGSVRVGRREVPMYRILLGGNAEGERACFDIPVGRVPAANVPQAVLRIFDLYRAQRRPDEAFGNWVRRRAAVDPKAAAAEA